MKYAADCEAVFGYFLHHFPYVGLRGEEDLEFHHIVGERMRELYEQTYGQGHTRRVESGRETGAAKTAYSMPANEKTLSIGAIQVAYSQPFAKVAYSQGFAKVAYSQGFTNAVKPAVSGAALETADVDASANQASTRCSHVRPTLSRAAA